MHVCTHLRQRVAFPLRHRRATRHKSLPKWPLEVVLADGKALKEIQIKDQLYKLLLNGIITFCFNLAWVSYLYQHFLLALLLIHLLLMQSIKPCKLLCLSTSLSNLHVECPILSLAAITLQDWNRALMPAKSELHAQRLSSTKPQVTWLPCSKYLFHCNIKSKIEAMHNRWQMVYSLLF